jgi:acetate kinase
VAVSAALSRVNPKNPVNVLVLNAGSSSLKFEVIATDLERIKQDSDDRLCKGSVEGLGSEAAFTTEIGGEGRHKWTLDLPDIQSALAHILHWIASDDSGIESIGSAEDIHAVGHRVVHGGEFFHESVLIDEDVLKAIQQCIELAPLHNPASVEGVRAARAFFGTTLPEVAVFDTAFHHTLPEHAYLYALPYKLYEDYKVRRYGFHGTSHRYVAHRYRMLRGLDRTHTNVISLHLGNGCSAAAIQRGISVDTSMGMTPLEGLIMGTRSGDIDPALVGVIADKERISAEDVELLLNKESGMLGVSGVSSDMRQLLQHRDSPKARLAVDMFCYRARKYIGAYLAAMGGADAVIFTGGIGENSPEVRGRICEGLEWAGLTLDHERNVEGSGERQISTDESKLAAFCIPTDEELLIARDTVRCIFGEPHPS